MKRTFSSVFAMAILALAGIASANYVYKDSKDQNAVLASSPSGGANSIAGNNMLGGQSSNYTLKHPGAVGLHKIGSIGLNLNGGTGIGLSANGSNIGGGSGDVTAGNNGTGLIEVTAGMGASNFSANDAGQG